MTENEVKRLATALATANGHSHVEDYADSVVQAWKEAEEAPKEEDDVAHS